MDKEFSNSTKNNIKIHILVEKFKYALEGGNERKMVICLI